MNWHVGQQVYCLRFGEGVITEIEENVIFPLKVKFNDGKYTRYLLDGFFDECEKTPMLYPSKPEIILPKWQPKKGEWCWFWDDIKAETVLGRFSMMNGNRFQCNLCLKWQNCAPFVGELPEHLKQLSNKEGDNI
jgi:hypothetical protein